MSDLSVYWKWKWKWKWNSGLIWKCMKINGKEWKREDGIEIALMSDLGVHWKWKWKLSWVVSGREHLKIFNILRKYSTYEKSEDVNWFVGNQKGPVPKQYLLIVNIDLQLDWESNPGPFCTRHGSQTIQSILKHQTSVTSLTSLTSQTSQTSLHDSLTSQTSLKICWTRQVTQQGYTD